MSAAWWISGAVGAAALTFAFRELLIGATGGLSRYIITMAARRLPEGRYQLRREEWLAEYDAMVAKGLHITGLTYACGSYLGALRMGSRRPHLLRLKKVSSVVHRYRDDLLLPATIEAIFAVSIWRDNSRAHAGALLTVEMVGASTAIVFLLWTIGMIVKNRTSNTKSRDPQRKP